MNFLGWVYHGNQMNISLNKDSPHAPAISVWLLGRFCQATPVTTVRFLRGALVDSFTGYEFEFGIKKLWLAVGDRIAKNVNDIGQTSSECQLSPKCPSRSCTLFCYGTRASSILPPKAVRSRTVRSMYVLDQTSPKLQYTREPKYIL